jgi:hypothetical protein
MSAKISIQDRMRDKALFAMDEVEYVIDKVMDGKKPSFSMYDYLTKLQYSSRVVTHMSGYFNETIYELKNEEQDEQLDEAYSFLTPKKKEYAIKFLEDIEKDIIKYCEDYKPVRKVRIKTPAQLVKKLPYQQRFAKYESIDPTEIIRARMLFTYNTASKKITCFESQGLSVKGSKIIGYYKCTEKTLTDLKLLDRLVSGGNIIASKFMDEIPRSKEKEGNDRITKNTLLVKAIR